MRLVLLVSVGVLMTIGVLMSTACDSDPQSSSKVVGNPVKGEIFFKGVLLRVSHAQGCTGDWAGWPELRQDEAVIRAKS
jgi:hypothetical protein